jgi:hypothetical protein
MTDVPLSKRKRLWERELLPAAAKRGQAMPRGKPEQIMPGIQKGRSIGRYFDSAHSPQNPIHHLLRLGLPGPRRPSFRIQGITDLLKGESPSSRWFSAKFPYPEQGLPFTG